MLSMSRNARVCVCVFVRPSMCSLFEVMFKRLFAPTSWGLMSKFFWDSESLMQSIAKKWFPIWTFLLKNGLKLPRQNKFLQIFFNSFTFKISFKRLFAPLSWQNLDRANLSTPQKYVCSLLRYRVNVFLPILSEVGCPKIVEMRNPWGTVVERIVLRFEDFCSQMV